eukprot:CAMPEP_0167793920 /NCGR_PEP_ID=MMETSP0111_2-20121227/13502_1 /TAXON_ID=91324 /ORGANISM="Lotharella globosa, Strain CCCM811" /LENGTH=164 /DNA_ID=CAMNT_0007687239 /DNA_START=20 /DNA_END=514 /DNA_ORIENTATION=+
MKRSWGSWLWDTVYNAAVNMTPHSLSLAVAVGFVGGLFPVPGATTIVTGILCGIFRANLAVAQALNFLVTPLEFLLMPAFFRLGELVLMIDSDGALHITGFAEAVRNDFFDALRQFRIALQCAVVGWAVVSMPAISIQYALGRFIMGFLCKRAAHKSKHEGHKK